MNTSGPITVSFVFLGEVNYSRERISPEFKLVYLEIYD
jgi:hypothetical protein